MDPEGLLSDDEEMAMLRGSAEAEAAQASTSGRGDGGVATAAAARRRRGRPRKDTKEAGAQQQGVADEWAADADLGDDSPVQLDGLPDGVTLTLGEQRRKSAILLELLKAGPQLESKLAQFRSEIDDVLVALMRLRLETAIDAGEEPAALAGYDAFYGRLCRERARAAASPAARLIDDALAALGEAAPGAPGYGEARRAAAALLRDAFSGGGMPVDIFTAAAALAEAGPLAAEALAVEAVSPAAFLAEALELLASARAAQRELQNAVTSAQAELAWAQQHQPELLARPDVKERLERLELAEAQIEPRARAIAQLEDLLALAQGAAEAAISSGGGGGV